MIKSAQCRGNQVFVSRRRNGRLAKFRHDSLDEYQYNITSNVTKEKPSVSLKRGYNRVNVMNHSLSSNKLGMPQNDDVEENTKDKDHIEV